MRLILEERGFKLFFVINKIGQIFPKRNEKRKRRLVNSRDEGDTQLANDVLTSNQLL